MCRARTSRAARSPAATTRVGPSVRSLGLGSPSVERAGTCGHSGGSNVRSGSRAALAVGFRGVDQLGRFDGLGRFGGSSSPVPSINTVSGAVAGSVDVGRGGQQHVDLRRHLRRPWSVPWRWSGWRPCWRARPDGSEVVELATAFGGSRVLSVPCESPPVVSIMTTIASTITVAAPATQIIERESFHQLPVGSSYSQATRSTHWREVDLRDGATDHRCCCRSRAEPLRSAALARLDWQIGLSAPDVRRIYRRNAGGCPAVSACGGPTPVRSGSGRPTPGSRRSSSPWPLRGSARVPGSRRSR